VRTYLADFKRTCEEEGAMDNLERNDKNSYARGQRRLRTAMSMVEIYRRRIQELEEENAALRLQLAPKTEPEPSLHKKALSPLHTDESFGTLLDSLNESLKKQSYLADEIAESANLKETPRAEIAAEEFIPDRSLLKDAFVFVQALSLSAILLLMRAAYLNFLT
jgi:hypothetical protein